MSISTFLWNACDICSELPSYCDRCTDYINGLNDVLKEASE